MEKNDELIKQFKSMLMEMTPEERTDTIYAVTEDFCTWCGRDDLPCYCMNDE